MRQLKKRHIKFKTSWQLLLLFLEVFTIVGILTWISVLLWNVESGLDILERIVLFYSFYQILTYVILSNLNDIKADEFLALKSNASVALKACEYNDKRWKELAKSQIEKQLDNGVFNDLQVRKSYDALKKYIDQNMQKDIEFLIIWAEHCAEESQLLWKFSFLLRLAK